MPCHCKTFCLMNEPYLFLVNEINNWEEGNSSYKDMFDEYISYREGVHKLKYPNMVIKNGYTTSFKEFKKWVKTNEKATFDYLKMLSLHLKDDADAILKEYYDGFLKIHINIDESNE